MMASVREDLSKDEIGKFHEVGSFWRKKPGRRGRQRIEIYKG